MEALQRGASESVLGTVGAAIAVSALALGSLVIIPSTALASAAPLSVAPGLSETGLPSASEVPALFMAEADPLDIAVDADVAEPEATEIEFADAVIDEGYTASGPVSEEEGDKQQVDAVEQALESTVDDSELQGIARMDLDADTAVIGVTWDATAPQPETVNWRFLSDGVWSQWGVLDVESSEQDEEVVAGTEPVSVSNAKAVEVVARTPEGNDVPGLALHVINAETFEPAENLLLDIYPNEDEGDEQEPLETDGGTSEEQGDSEQPQSGEPGEEGQSDEPGGPGQSDTALDTQGLVETDGVSIMSSLLPSVFGIVPTAGLNAAGTIYDTGYDGLKIGTRKAWCTTDSCDVTGWSANTIKGAVVHHTESTNNYTQAQVPQQLRNIQYYHAVTRGWGDIGYNLVVDKYGGVWEGRVASLTNQVLGAHAYGANYDTFGITVLGGYMDTAPPVVARQALSKAIAWKLNMHGVKSATDKITIRSQWGTSTVPTVSAHRDVGDTDCPGNAFYAQMDTVRAEVNAHLAILNSTQATTTTPSTSTFSPGNVISDAVFYNSSAMTEAQIKTFIESAG
ncbi:MAG: N-acetylmuramoyl-L-alanine amidase, partial [Scrofimicrobium sp.]